MKIEYKSISEIGKVRKNNEDHVFCDAPKGIYAVADGMGGEAQGEKASEIVCLELGRTKEVEKFSARIDAIGVSLATANRIIYDYAKANGFNQMGSTVALIVFEGGDSKRAAICHIGDSRVYRIRDGVAELFTSDHSVGAELAATLGKRGNSNTFRNRSNPLAHLLTRAIGIEKEVRCEWRKIDVEPGDRYVVCSDGVHDVIETDEIVATIGNGNLENQVARLSAAVLERGAPDNYSIVIIRTEV